MTTNKQRIIDLLAMGRVANLPSVVCNVLLGCALGFDYTSNSEFFQFALPCYVGCLLYLGGCFLNDWKDSDWDAEHKSERPIPSGRWSKPSIFTLSFSFIFVGLIVAGSINNSSLIVAFLIFISIYIYTRTHKEKVWAIIPMGMCRALLYLLGFTSQGDPTEKFEQAVSTILSIGHHSKYALFEFFLNASIIIPMFGILCYIAGLSLLARFESKGNLPYTNKVAAIILMCIPIFTHNLRLLGESFFIPNLRPAYLTPLLALIATTPLIICIAISIKIIKKSVSRGVSLLLAGIITLDLIIFIPAGLSYIFSAINDTSSLLQSIYPIFMIIAIIAFLLSLLLQRIAPAT